jgi:hypothetical protein
MIRTPALRPLGAAALVAVCLAVSVAVCFGGLAPAAAQKSRNQPQAFAAVQAPEAAADVCHSKSARSALDCARKMCERKTVRGACFVVTVCEPMGWSGLMGVQLSEVHFSKALCGAPSKEALVTALKAYCQGHPGLRQCLVSHVWSPDGKQQTFEATWTPDDLKK